MVRLGGGKDPAKQSKETTGTGGVGAKTPTKEGIYISPGLRTCLTELSRALQVNENQRDDSTSQSTDGLSADARGGGIIPAHAMLERTTESLVNSAFTIRGQGDSINALRGWFKQRVRVWDEVSKSEDEGSQNSSSEAIPAKRARVSSNSETCDKNQETNYNGSLSHRARCWLLERIEESSGRHDPQELQLEKAAVITYSLTLLISHETSKLRRWTVPLINVCKTLDSELFLSIFDRVTEGVLHHFYQEAKKPTVTNEEQKEYERRLENLDICIEDPSATASMSKQNTVDERGNDDVFLASSESDWYMGELTVDANSLTCLEASQELWLRFLQRESPPTISILLDWSSHLLLSLGVKITRISETGNISSSLMAVQKDVDELLKIVGGLLHTLNKSIIGISSWRNQTWTYVQRNLLEITKFSLFLQGTLQWHLYTSNQIALVFVHSVLACHRITWLTSNSNESQIDADALINPLCGDIFCWPVDVSSSHTISPILLKKPKTNNAKFRSLAARACNGVFPNGLLIQTMYTKSQQTPQIFLLDVLYRVIREFTGDVEPLIRSQAFQALLEWIKKVRSLVDDLLKTIDGSTLRDVATEIVEITLYNWEHPAKHVSNMMQSIFREILKLYSEIEERINSHTSRSMPTESYRSTLLTLLSYRRNTRKSKFAALETLCSKWGVLECLNMYPNLLGDILAALKNSANVSGPVSSCWFELLVKARQECEQSVGLNPGSYLGTGSQWQPGNRPKAMSETEYDDLYQQALSKWRQLWIEPFHTALISPIRKLRIGCAEYIIPRVLKLDSACIDEVMKHLSSQSQAGGVEEIGDDGNCLDDRVLWAQLYLIQVARQHSLFSSKLSQNILDAAAQQVPESIVKLFHATDVLNLSSVCSLLRTCFNGQEDVGGLEYGRMLFNGLVHQDIELRVVAFKSIACCGKQSVQVTKSEIVLMLVWFLTSTKTSQQEIKHQMTPVVSSFLDRIVHCRESQKRLEFLEKVQYSYLDRYGNGRPAEKVLNELIGSKHKGVVVNVDGEEIDMTEEMAEGITTSAHQNAQWRDAALSAALVQIFGYLLLSGMYTSAPFDKVGVTMAFMKELIRFFPVAFTSTCASRQEARDYSALLKQDQNEGFWLLDNPLKNPLFPVLCNRASTEIFLSSLRGNWDQIRLDILSLLNVLPSPLCGVETEEEVNDLFQYALQCLCNPKPRDCDIGGCILRVLYVQYVQKSGWCLTDTVPAKLCFESEGLSVNDRRIQFINLLLDLLSRRTRILDKYVTSVVEQDNQQRDDFGLMVVNVPNEDPVFHSPLIHGVLLGLRYLLQATDWKKMDRAALEQYRPLFSKTTKIVLDAYKTALKIVAETDEGDGNLMAEDGRQGASKGRVDCRGHLIFDSNSSDPASQNVSGEEDESPQQTLAVAAWMVIREGSACLYELISTCLSFGNGKKDEVSLVSTDTIQLIGDALLEALLSLKHMGGVTYATVNFQKTCKELFVQPSEELRSIPIRWVDRLFQKVTDGGHQFILRRSAGLPLGIRALVCAEPTFSSAHLLHRLVVSLMYLADSDSARDEYDGPTESSWMKKLEAVDAPSCVLNVKTPSWRMKVHSLNTLRMLVRESSLMSEMQPYLPRILRAGMLGFQSVQWAVRNSSMMVFAAVLDKMVGTKRESNETSEANRVASDVFFNRYPTLRGLLLQCLEQSLADLDQRPEMEESSTASSLYPVLLVLSRLDQPSTTGTPAATHVDEDASTISSFVPLVLGALTLKEYWIRQLAANVLNNLLNYEEKSLMILSLVSRVCEDSYTSLRGNEVHGYLFGALRLLSALREAYKATSAKNASTEYNSHLPRRQAAYSRVRKKAGVEEAGERDSSGIPHRERLKGAVSDIRPYMPSLLELCHVSAGRCPWVSEVSMHLLHLFVEAEGDTLEDNSELLSSHTVRRLSELCYSLLSSDASKIPMLGRYQLMSTATEVYSDCIFSHTHALDDHIDVLAFMLKHNFREVRWRASKVIKRKLKEPCTCNVVNRLGSIIIEALGIYFDPMGEGMVAPSLETSDAHTCRYLIRSLRLLTEHGEIDLDAWRTGSLMSMLITLHDCVNHEKIRMDSLLLLSRLLGSQCYDASYLQAISRMMTDGCRDSYSYQRRLHAMKAIASMDKCILVQHSLISTMLKEVYQCTHDEDDEVRDGARLATYSFWKAPLAALDSKNGGVEYLVGKSDVWTHALAFRTIQLLSDRPSEDIEAIVTHLASSTVAQITAIGNPGSATISSISSRMFTTESQNEFFEPVVALLYCLSSVSEGTASRSLYSRLSSDVDNAQESLDQSARMTLHAVHNDLKSLAKME